MGVYLNISSALKAKQQQLMHDHFDLFKRSCTLIYTGEQVPCEACGGNQTTNYWADGTPFGRPDNCVFCGGSHYKVQEVEEAVDLLIIWKPKEMEDVGGSVRKPNGFIKARGRIADWPKILRANKILVSPPIQNLARTEYVRVSEPVDENGYFNSQYFSVFLGRA
jgi:hypothetical protein